METTQIYEIVNSTMAQSIGTIGPRVIDERGLISMGDAVLSSSANTEAFMNTLVQRIGKVIIASRNYKSNFKDMVMDEFTFGAIVQKVKIQMMSFEESDVYDLKDGVAVDQQKVNKPKAIQKLFVTRTPYKITLTLQEYALKEAFTSSSSMGAFINGIYTELENTIEFRIDTMGKNCLNNFIATVKNSNRHIKLLSIYEDETGNVLTKDEALVDEKFLRWSVGLMNKISKYMTDISIEYNDGSIPQFTPLESQKMRVLTSFETALETQMQYGAFNDGYVKLLKGYKTINHFQSVLAPGLIDIIPANSETGDSVSVDTIVGVLYDERALGIFNKNETVRTAPFNASGLYMNTFYHFKEMYFNDLSENFVLFTLA